MVDKDVIALGHRRARPFVFALNGGQNRLYARSTAAIKIAVVKTRRDLLVNNPFAKRIRQHGFQSIADLQKHLVALDKNKKHRAVVSILLTDFPGPRHADGVIINGRIRLHRRVDGDQDLVERLPLKIFERAV